MQKQQQSFFVLKKKSYHNQQKQKKQSSFRRKIYFLNFLFNLQGAMTVYYFADYLKFLGLEQNISLVFLNAFLLMLVFILLIPRLFALRGVLMVMLSATLAIIVGYSLLILDLNIWLNIVALILLIALTVIVTISLDVYLERFIESEIKTGRQRGIFITMASTAFVLGAFLGGLVLENGGFQFLWLTAIILLSIFLGISVWVMHSLSKVKYNFMFSWHLLKSKDRRYVFLAQFILYIFYAIMVFYAASFLREEFGWSYQEIGLIFAFMLTPFVFLTEPLGQLADIRLGEKEIMVTGFFIMSFSVLAFALNTKASLVLTAAILFLTRVGAAAVGAMTETHFFKTVTEKDLNIISAFRSIYPLAYITAHFLALLILKMGNMRVLFAVLAVICLTGVFFASQIEDSR